MASFVKEMSVLIVMRMPLGFRSMDGLKVPPAPEQWKFLLPPVPVTAGGWGIRELFQRLRGGPKGMARY